MSNTPRTDKEIRSQYSRGNSILSLEGFCKGLERELKEMHATALEYAASSDRAHGEIADLKRKLNPFQWSLKENDAWHRNIPDLQRAFTDLLNSK